jgi:hypothetical protein
MVSVAASVPAAEYVLAIVDFPEVLARAKVSNIAALFADPESRMQFLPSRVPDPGLRRSRILIRIKEFKHS